jgi:hypothetical protein
MGLHGLCNMSLLENVIFERGDALGARSVVQNREQIVRRITYITYRS